MTLFSFEVSYGNFAVSVKRARFVIGEEASAERLLELDIDGFSGFDLHAFDAGKLGGVSGSPGSHADAGDPHGFQFRSGESAHVFRLGWAGGRGIIGATDGGHRGQSGSDAEGFEKLTALWIDFGSIHSVQGIARLDYHRRGLHLSIKVSMQSGSTPMLFDHSMM